jgi:predicted secreted acid phosphatase
MEVFKMFGKKSRKILGMIFQVLVIVVLVTSIAFANSETYTVQPGDSLIKIGAELGINWRDLAEYNNIEDVRKIYIGEVLRLGPAYTTKDFNEQLVMATLWMQTAAEYDALCYQAFNLGKMLVDNSAYEAGLIGTENAYSSKTWDVWMQAAEAKAIPGAVEFLNYAHEQGVETFYVTNRKIAPGYEGTMKNLLDLGFPNVDEKHLMLRTDTSNKQPRRDMVLEEYEVIFYMGDNCNDFSEDYYHTTLEERNAAAEADKDKFGIEFIVLPNPTYGDWDGAIFEFNWGATPAEKDAYRKNALERWVVGD